MIDVCLVKDCGNTSAEGMFYGNKGRICLPCYTMKENVTRLTEENEVMVDALKATRRRLRDHAQRGYIIGAITITLLDLNKEDT